MQSEHSQWAKISPIVYVGVAFGALGGGWLGYLACFAYDLWNGPFLPQAEVDPNPAGWEGWWIGPGAILGSGVGWLVSWVVLMIWRAIQGPQARPSSAHR